VCRVSRPAPSFTSLLINLTHPSEVRVSSHLKWDHVSIFHQRIPPPLALFRKSRVGLRHCLSVVTLPKGHLEKLIVCFLMKLSPAALLSRYLPGKLVPTLNCCFVSADILDSLSRTLTLSRPPTGLSLYIAAPSFFPYWVFNARRAWVPFSCSLVSVDMCLLCTFSSLVPDLYTTVLLRFFFTLYHCTAPVWGWHLGYPSCTCSNSLVRFDLKLFFFSSHLKFDGAA